MQKQTYWCCSCAKFSSFCLVIFIFSCIFSSLLWRTFFGSPDTNKVHLRSNVFSSLITELIGQISLQYLLSNQNLFSFYSENGKWKQNNKNRMDVPNEAEMTSSCIQFAFLNCVQAKNNSVNNGDYASKRVGKSLKPHQCWVTVENHRFSLKWIMIIEKVVLT